MAAASTRTPPPARDPFTGTFETHYEGSAYQLQLRSADGQRYEGVVVLEGEQYPIAGVRRGGALVGRFHDPDGSEYGYVGRVSRASLVFELEDDDPITFQGVGAMR